MYELGESKNFQTQCGATTLHQTKKTHFVTKIVISSLEIHPKRRSREKEILI